MTRFVQERGASLATVSGYELRIWVKFGFKKAQTDCGYPVLNLDGIIGMIVGSVRTIFFDTCEKNGTDCQLKLNWGNAKKADGRSLVELPAVRLAKPRPGILRRKACSTQPVSSRHVRQI